MPIRERLLLAVAMFAACAALWGAIIAAVWLIETLLQAGGATTALAAFALLIFGLCFGMTFLSGAPRWFQRKDL